MVILAIVGYRNFNDYDRFVDEITARYDVTDIDEIVSGACQGTDTLAEKFAAAQKIPFVAFHADWQRYGKAAGPKRNTQIVDRCTDLIAFLSKESRGTLDSIAKAKKADRVLHVVDID